jgi:hypothetical protein
MWVDGIRRFNVPVQGLERINLEGKNNPMGHSKTREDHERKSAVATRKTSCKWEAELSGAQTDSPSFFM